LEASTFCRAGVVSLSLPYPRIVVREHSLAVVFRPSGVWLEEICSNSPMCPSGSALQRKYDRSRYDQRPANPLLPAQVLTQENSGQRDCEYHAQFIHRRDL